MVNLVQKWQKDEITAFEALFLRYKDMVLRTAISMLGDEASAEDILQIAFIKVYKQKKKFQGDEVGFRCWLSRISINLCIDLRRKRQPNLYLEQINEGGYNEFLSSRMEAEEQLYQVLQGLDSRQRAAIVLRYLHEFSYVEIAHTIGISLGTVKSLLNTAMKVLQKKLLEERE